MGTAATPTRVNRTITVDFQNEATYFQLLGDGKAFVECVLAFILSLGFQLIHKTTCRGGGCLTRHSHYARVRLGGLSIWRMQCTTCKAVFTILPHFVLRYRSMRPDVARDALLATHGGLFGWEALGGTPFRGVPVPRHITPGMDDHEERRRVRVKADATFHPHTGCEACQRRCTLRTATLLVFPP
jgi:hypothetical protein